MHPQQSKFARWVPVLISSLVFLYVLVGPDQLMFPGHMDGMLLLILFAFIAFQVFSKYNKPFQFLGTVMLSYIYITISMVLLLKIGTNDNEFIMSSDYFNGEKVLTVFILIWASDTFAYLIGRWLGKTKLAPNLSPGKTVEGAIGGLILTGATAYVLYLTMGVFRLTDYLIISAIVFFFGLMGDLLVSKLKRSMDLKDSGSVLPGHGGFLDRFDSILLAAPMVYLYLSFVS